MTLTLTIPQWMIDVGFGAVVLITGLTVLAFLARCPMRLLAYVFKSRGVYVLVPVMLSRRKIDKEVEATWYFCEEVMKRMIRHEPRPAKAMLERMADLLERVNQERAKKDNEP